MKPRVILLLAWTADVRDRTSGAATDAARNLRRVSMGHREGESGESLLVEQVLVEPVDQFGYVGDGLDEGMPHSRHCLQLAFRLVGSQPSVEVTGLLDWHQFVS